MQDTKGLMEKMKHHDKVSVFLNENCSVPLSAEVLNVILKPHRLSYYYFQYLDEGTASFRTDLDEFSISGGEVAFGLPNQFLVKMPFDQSLPHYSLYFEDSAVALLPGHYLFLVNPFNAHSISFDPETRTRVKNLLSALFQLLHAPGKQKKVEVILAHLHTVLTEFNTAYFEQYGELEAAGNSKLSKFIAFKLAIEENLTEQYQITDVAEKLALSSNALYSIVKEFAGVSPKEWITGRLVLEAQKQMHYAQDISVKELAYGLGFNDPGYFSRLFKKNTGKSVSRYLADLQDLSHN